MSQQPMIGITVMPEYIQVETVEGLLDNLQKRAGANALSTSPYVMAPAPEGTGSREPPADGGAGGARLLDRPLWGRRELTVRTSPSYAPDRRLYAGLRYQPAAQDELGRRDGPLVETFIRSAKARGLAVYLQVQAAIPPGYRVQFGGPGPEDEPLGPDGRPIAGRVDRNASLASPDILAYGAALLTDLARAYPEIDGFRIDWPEYPPYSFDALFFDFSSHAEAAAGRLGIDVERMRADTLALRRQLLTGLTDADLSMVLSDDGGRYALLRLARRWPGAIDLLRLKAALSAGLLATYRQALDAAAPHMALVPSAFPPPWSAISGFDFAAAARSSRMIGVKLYTMHWPMMLSDYARAVMAASPGLTEELVVRALARLLDLEAGLGLTSIADYAYPAPDQAHPVGLAAQERKIRQAQAEAGSVPVYALTHGYGPPDDVRRRLEAGFRASEGRLWVNRYGYLSDAKLDAIGAIAGG